MGIRRLVGSNFVKLMRNFSAWSFIQFLKVLEDCTPMKVRHFSPMLIVLLCLLASIASQAQTAKKHPMKMPPGMFDRFKSGQGQLRVPSRLSTATRGDISSDNAAQNSKHRTIPFWNGSFVSGGVTYPYQMAGGNPKRGGDTDINSALLPLNFFFDEFVDDNGNNLEIDIAPDIGVIATSPNFYSGSYSVGFGQFGDAVQRASFWTLPAVQKSWHTTVNSPRLLPTVTIEVPPGAAQVFAGDNGQPIAFIDSGFMESQLNTISQMAVVSPDEVLIVAGRNITANDFLGFHTAYEVPTENHKTGIQTFIWTSWFDPGTIPDIFADATTITHEVSEWIADPFINNATPPRAIPGSEDSHGVPVCLNVLEVGDVIEFLDTQMYPITLHGFNYHTQNEALLPWFTGQVPSPSFQGAYSYPDTTVVTSPGVPCTP